MSDRADPRAAAELFGVSPVDEISVLPGSTTNDNYVFADGSAQRFVLRRYLRNVDVDRIEFQIALQRHLVSARFPTPEPVPSTTGRDVVAKSGVWSLWTFAEGEHFDFSRPAQVREAALKLAEFHEITKTFTTPEVDAGGRTWTIDWCRHVDERLDDVREFFRDSAVDDELDAQEKALRTLISSVPVGDLEELERGWVHGDYHGLNMFFEGDRLAALIDFDAVHSDARLEDVGRGVFAFGREYRGSTTLRPEVVRLFLESYHSMSPLTALERSFLPAFVAAYWAEDAEHSRRYAQMGKDPIRELRRKLPILQALCRQTDVVARIADDLR